MLVLSRKPGEQIVIGSDIRVTVIELKGGKVKIGIDAPNDVAIYRAELRDWVDESRPKEVADQAGAAPSAKRVVPAPNPVPNYSV